MSEHGAMVGSLLLAREAAKVVARHRGALALNPWEADAVQRFLADFLPEDQQ